LVKFTALNKKNHFEDLKNDGFCFTEKGLRVFAKLNSETTSRLGVSVSSKDANAVSRNKFKRRIKEATRGLDQKEHIDILVIANKQAARLDFQEINDVFEKHPLFNENR
jgi:ribonuclease P protein component